MFKAKFNPTRRYLAFVDAHRMHTLADERSAYRETEQEIEQGLA